MLELPIGDEFGAIGRTMGNGGAHLGRLNGGGGHHQHESGEHGHGHHVHCTGNVIGGIGPGGTGMAQHHHHRPQQNDENAGLEKLSGYWISIT